MKTASELTLDQRRQQLDRAIVANERRQRKVRRALAKGRAVPPSAPPSAPAPLISAPAALPAAPLGHDRPVRFTEDNASIFMSGNLEEIRGRAASPVERRNRRLILVVFLVVVLVGVLYMLLG